MPSDADRHIFNCAMTLENALIKASPDHYSEITDAINRLIDAHVQRAAGKKSRSELDERSRVMAEHQAP